MQRLVHMTSFSLLCSCKPFFGASGFCLVVVAVVGQCILHRCMISLCFSGGCLIYRPFQRPLEWTCLGHHQKVSPLITFVAPSFTVRMRSRPLTYLSSVQRSFHGLEPPPLRPPLLPSDFSSAVARATATCCCSVRALSLAFNASNLASLGSTLLH